MDRSLVETIEQLQSCHELLEIKETLILISKKLGFDYVLYAIKCPDTFTRSSTFIISDYPQEWLEHYGNEGYVNIDPVAQHCFSSPEPYHWNCFKDYQQDEIKVFVQEARNFKIYDGISIGMSGFHGETGLFSLTSKTALVTDSDSFKYAIACMSALQTHIHTSINRISNLPLKKINDIGLTEREKSCLLWVAEGKTAQDIAVILSISEVTVVFHLKNCIRKLNVTNRSQAIAKAVLLGLIVPQFTSTAVPTYHF